MTKKQLQQSLKKIMSLFDHLLSGCVRRSGLLLKEKDQEGKEELLSHLMIGCGGESSLIHFP